MQKRITSEIAATVLAVVDRGLVMGVGIAKPGKMCVEAAVCYALGQDHGDDPWCVDKQVRSAKISLNDKQWTSKKARGRGLREVAVAQLGTKGKIDDTEFLRAMHRAAIIRFGPYIFTPKSKRYAPSDDALRLYNDILKWVTSAGYSHMVATPGWGEGFSPESQYNITGLAGELHKVLPGNLALEVCADVILDALKAVKSPGVKWLYLTEESQSKLMKRLSKERKAFFGLRRRRK